MTRQDSSPGLTAMEAHEMLPPHRRVAIEYRAVLKHLAEMLKADPTGHFAIDLFGTLETALEQRVAVLCEQSYQEGYHAGRRAERRMGGDYD